MNYSFVFKPKVIKFSKKVWAKTTKKHHWILSVHFLRQNGIILNLESSKTLISFGISLDFSFI